MQHKDSTEHGIDISASRLDDIDREVINFALDYKGRKVAVDIGCGYGRVSIILALVGFDVWLYDVQDLHEHFSRVGDVLGISERIHFTQVDINEIRGKMFPTGIVIALSQRTLHHVRYDVAKHVLHTLKQKMIQDGKLFLSVSGMESKLADAYECANSPIHDRFCQVGEVGKDIYSIHGDVCLYTKEELANLVGETGISIDNVYESAFGNIKLIGSNS